MAGGEGGIHLNSHNEHDTCVKHTSELAINLEVTQIEHDFGVFGDPHPQEE